MELTGAKINLECIHSKYIMRNDGILEIQLADDFYFTVKESKEITANIINITNGIPYKVMVVAGSLSLSDDGARNYSTTKESTDPIISLAIVTCSLPQSIIANFIMKFQKPRIPTKVFNSKVDAVEWLNDIENFN
jgi:hypothetical protein